MTDKAQITPTPCIGVCTIDEDTGFCLGCARDVQEVAQWKALDEPAKQAIAAQLSDRKRAMEAQGVEGRWTKI